MFLEISTIVYINFNHSSLHLYLIILFKLSIHTNKPKIK